MGQDSVAEDLTQEVFVRLAESIERDTQIRDLRAFISGLMTNVFREHLRRRNRRKEVLLPEVDGSYGSDAAPSGHLEREELAFAIRKLFRELKEADQELVAAVYFFGLTMTQAAEALGMSRQTFSYRFYRAMDKLRGLARTRGILPPG
jgi:RNA polymerase sigma factor (sigma-70 family)